MQSERRRIIATFVLLATLLFATPAFPRIWADPVSELSVQTSANVIRAASNNTITMQIQGIGKLLANLDVSLDLPSPLVLFGDNHWRRSSFGPGNSILVSLMIFAPSTAAGNSYQATLTAVYKEAGETTYSQETHTIGLLVRGWIDIVIYDTSVDPSIAGPGSTVTVSGSLLNRGITSAMFTNLTIKPESPLIVGSDGVSYLGQVDPNAPAPFSVSAQVEPTTPDGQYNAALVVYYQDDLHMDQQVETVISFDVSSSAVQTTTTAGPRGPIDLVLAYGQYLIGLVVLVVVVLIALRLRRRRSNASS